MRYASANGLVAAALTLTHWLLWARKTAVRQLVVFELGWKNGVEGGGGVEGGVEGGVRECCWEGVAM